MKADLRYLRIFALSSDSVCIITFLGVNSYTVACERTDPDGQRTPTLSQLPTRPSRMTLENAVTHNISEILMFDEYGRADKVLSLILSKGSTHSAPIEILTSGRIQ